MKISLAVCVYNEERNLNNFLDSLLSQSFKEFELVVVDDGSTDNTLNILKKYKSRFNMKIIETSHLGLRPARYQAVINTNGEIVITLDADEILEKNCLCFLVNHFEDSLVGGVGGIINPCGTGWVIEGMSTLSSLMSSLRGTSDADWISGGCAAYRRKALIEIGWLRTDNVGEDVHASWMLKKHGWKLVIDPNAICYHKDPPRLKDVLLKEYNVGKRAKTLYLLHKYKLFNWKFLSRFLPMLLILLLLFNWIFTLIGLVLSFVLFVLLTGSKHTFSNKVFGWTILNFINLAWIIGVAREVFRVK